MDYVAVLGASPSESTKKPVEAYFKDYLISIAEPTTSKSWSLFNITKQMTKILKTKIPQMKLYLDSGGYQVITGHITENRLKEYTDSYHFVLKKYRKEIDYIFSFDINNMSFDQDKILRYNEYSIKESAKLISLYPEIKEKQLFVIQSRTPQLLEDWKTLMENNQVFNHWDLFSFGGLVGLKSQTCVQFNHFVPMTAWLMSFAKKENKEVKQIHMLGQSSRVAIVTGTILEKLYNIKITMDSSEIIRFSPIKFKVPMVLNQSQNFEVIRDLTGMQKMINVYSESLNPEKKLEISTNLRDGKVSNQTFVELISQNINNTISLANKLVLEVPIEELITWKEEDFIKWNSFFSIGRLAKELQNNMKVISLLNPSVQTGDFNNVHSYCKTLISTYYNPDDKCKTGDINNPN